MSFNPIKSISSRYSIQNINSILIGKKASNDGYVYAPYIPMELTPLLNDEEYREILRIQQRELRKEKLNKLNNIFLFEK